MRIIDGDALRNVMYHEAFETDSNMQRWDSGCWIRYKMFENAIDNAPTVDAVPVVRCRDCKNWESDWKPDIFVQDPPRHYCAINDRFLTGDWFCAAGERIEVDNNK